MRRHHTQQAPPSPPGTAQGCPSAGKLANVDSSVVIGSPESTGTDWTSWKVIDRLIASFDGAVLNVAPCVPLHCPLRGSEAYSCLVSSTAALAVDYSYSRRS